MKNMSNSNKVLIEEFCKIFDMTPDDWTFWKREHGCSDKLIIAGPSRIIGLVDLTKIDDEINWKSYGKNAEPTKKMKGNFVFDGGMYGITFLRDAFPMLAETIEVAKYSEAIFFRVGEDVALGIAQKYTNEGFYYNDEGVMFAEWDWEETKKEWRSVVKENEFIKWENGVAKREHKGKCNIWYEEVYRWEYFFEVEEEMGDFMLL